MDRHSSSLVHIADLRTVGGVERMLVDFIKSTPNIEHHLILQNKTIHPSFIDILNCTNSCFSIKHFSGIIPLPKKLRHRHFLHIIKKTKAQHALIWNQVINLENVNIPCTYYEHGSAWYTHSQEKIHACFNKVKQVIAVSHAAKRMLQIQHKVTSNITVLHNTLRPSLNYPENLNPRTLTKEIITLGVASRLVSIKCIPLLVLTIKWLKEQGIQAKAKIAGTGVEEGAIRSLVDQYQLQENIELLGFVGDMNLFYQQIDCYVCTSMHESFGLSGLDAMAYGLPVITANVDGLPEAISHNFNGFCIEPTWSVEEYRQNTQASTSFCPYIYYPKQDDIGPVKLLDPEKIALNIKKWVDNSSLYSQMSENALITTKQSVSFDNLCKNVLNILKNAS